MLTSLIIAQILSWVAIFALGIALLAVARQVGVLHIRVVWSVNRSGRTPRANSSGSSSQALPSSPTEIGALSRHDCSIQAKASSRSVVARSR